MITSGHLRPGVMFIYTAKKVLFALSGASTLLSTSFVILSGMVSRGDAAQRAYRFRIKNLKMEAMPRGPDF